MTDGIGLKLWGALSSLLSLSLSPSLHFRRWTFITTVVVTVASLSLAMPVIYVHRIVTLNQPPFCSAPLSTLVHKWSAVEKLSRSILCDSDSSLAAHHDINQHFNICPPLNDHCCFRRVAFTSRHTLVEDEGGWRRDEARQGV